jgi:hypothetical protein
MCIPGIARYTSNQGKADGANPHKTRGIQMSILDLDLIENLCLLDGFKMVDLMNDLDMLDLILGLA